MYKVLVIPRGQRDLDDLPPSIVQRVIPVLKKIGELPRGPGSIKLAGEEGYRVRVGDYRILYRIDDAQKAVYIYRVRHRKEVYRD